jgi:5-methylcytosine-specific restriction endonuclease McrA
MITRRWLRNRGSGLRQKAEPKPPSVLHPHKRYPVSQREWLEMVEQLFARSGGRCERCGKTLRRATMEPHHVTSRAKGGPDALDNLLAVCHACHEEIHGKPQWSQKGIA